MFSAALYAHVHFVLCTTHMRPRVQRASGIPCALCLERAESFWQSSGAMRRENAATHSTVIAREGGRPSIPETPMVDPIGRGVLVPPLSRRTTTHVDAGFINII